MLPAFMSQTQLADTALCLCWYRCWGRDEGKGARSVFHLMCFVIDAQPGLMPTPLLAGTLTRARAGVCTMSRDGGTTCLLLKSLAGR